MKVKSVKFWNLIGVCIGIVVIIMGIVLACTPAESYTTAASRDAKFGGDYYTYQYEASKNAAGNAAAAANNLREIGEKLALYSGLLFVVMGLLITLTYAKKYFLEEDFDFVDDEDFDYEQLMDSIYDDEELDVAEVVEVGEEPEAEAPAEEAPVEEAPVEEASEEEN